jgi:hypothetical protein
LSNFCNKSCTNEVKAETQIKIIGKIYPIDEESLKAFIAKHFCYYPELLESELNSEVVVHISGDNAD